jgi:tetratricopeptide (TPR) repeat protein
MHKEDRLVSWKEIAAYLDRDERTVQRWHTKSGLPVHHVPGSTNSSVFAYRTEVDAWLNRDRGYDALRHPGPISSSSFSEALELWECRNEGNQLRIIELCYRALTENPRDPQALGLLANAYIWAANIDLIPASYAFARAQRAVDKALRFQRDQEYARCAEAWLAICKDHKRQFAEAGFRECIATCPHFSVALIGLATVCVLQQKFDEARDLAMRAWDAEPLSGSVSYSVIRLHYCMGDFARVISETQRAMSTGESSSALHAIFGLAHAAMGDITVALARLEESADTYRTSHLVKGALGYAYASAGHFHRANDILAELAAEPPNMKASSEYATALVYSGLGEADPTLEWLQRCEAGASIWGLTVDQDPAFSWLKNQDEFRTAAGSQCDRKRRAAERSIARVHNP